MRDILRKVYWGWKWPGLSHRGHWRKWRHFTPKEKELNDCVMSCVFRPLAQPGLSAQELQIKDLHQLLRSWVIATRAKQMGKMLVQTMYFQHMENWALQNKALMKSSQEQGVIRAVHVQMVAQWVWTHHGRCRHHSLLGCSGGSLSSFSSSTTVKEQGLRTVLLAGLSCS